MDIITLIENTKNFSKDLTCEKGISLYIKKDNKHIIFDTGRSGNFISNAEKLGVNIRNIDAVILSHGHGDHGGGILYFFNINDKAKVYMKKECKNNYYFKYSFFKANIGINKEIFEKYYNRIVFINGFTEIIKDIYLITDITKKYTSPKGNKYMYTEINNKLVKDTFKHELIMVIKDKNELSIFSGCSHNGIPNIIETVRTKFWNINIKALIGGFHLIKIPIFKFSTAATSEINLVVKKIIDENIQNIYTGHCTGKIAYKKLEVLLGNKIHYISTGTKIVI